MSLKSIRFQNTASRVFRLFLAAISVLVFLALTGPIKAQILVEDPQRGQSRVGEGAARDYFRARQSSTPEERAPVRSPAQADAARYMAIQAGTYISDKQHRWGQKRRDEDVGELLLGVTYRMGEWTNSMDLLMRVEFQTFDVAGETPRKLSVMPMIAFPDARSGFPFYLGAGAGAGVFFKQARGDSDLSLDYQIVTGLRFPTLFDWGGLIVETGIKGHVHLLSSGQFNGVFLTAGTVFNF